MLFLKGNVSDVLFSVAFFSHLFSVLNFLTPLHTVQQIKIMILQCLNFTCSFFALFLKQFNWKSLYFLINRNFYCFTYSMSTNIARSCIQLPLISRKSQLMTVVGLYSLLDCLFISICTCICYM